MGEYIDKDMIKSLVRIMESLTKENEELRQELKEMRNNYGYCIQLTDEQKEKIEMAWKDFKEGQVKMRYVADDGMEFDTEQECLDYEREQMKIRDNFVLYDKDFNKIDVNDTDNYEYLYVTSDVQGVVEYLRYWVGICDGLDDTGLYWLNGDGEWMFVNDLIDRHKKELDILETAVRKIQPLEKSCETCKYFCKSTDWCSQYNDTTYSTNCALYQHKGGD